MRESWLYNPTTGAELFISSWSSFIWFWHAFHFPYSDFCSFIPT